MSQRAAFGGKCHFSRIGRAALGLVLSLLALPAFAAPATGAGIDPMREARPAPSYAALPDIAPPRGSLVPFLPSGAGAAVSVTRGGIAAPRTPRVGGVSCVRRCVSTRKATPGALVRISGGYLAGVTRVVFRGKNGWIRRRPRASTAASVRAVVPKRAVRGRVFVVDRFGVRSNSSPRELGIGPVSDIPVEVFPVRGPFSFGSSGSRFGAGRPGHIHQGQDLGASCGLPVVSVREGRVIRNSFQAGGAGNYVVVKNRGTNTSFVYMHMLKRSGLKVGRTVDAGTVLGRVGNTGASFGCHLHFEYWVGPWYFGGKPVDPLRYLKSLRR